MCPMCRRYSKYKTCCGQKTVVCAENCGTQPADAIYRVVLNLELSRVLFPDPYGFEKV